MSVVPAPPNEQVNSIRRAAVVTLAWLAVVLATARLCRPWPGTEVLVPAVVAVAIPIVVLIGRPVGGVLVLFGTAVLAMTMWGAVGGGVLVVATVVAVVVLPIHSVRDGLGGADTAER
ncbi:hypothetical protein ACFYUK_19170 [Nonomuraea wenchangensis]